MPNDTLLTPDNHGLLMIDHQYLQLLALRSHPNEAVVNNSVFLAKAAKVFDVPTCTPPPSPSVRRCFRNSRRCTRNRWRLTAPASTRGTTRASWTGS